MAAATEVIRRSMSTLAGLFTKKLPAGIWQFTFDEVGKGMKYVVNGRRYEFLAINGVMGITIDATNEKHLWYVISDDCTVQIEEVGQAANPFSSIPHDSGLWTPVLDFEVTGNMSCAYNHQAAKWYLLGDMVFVDFSIYLSAFTLGTATGDLLITGLPFTSSSIDVRSWGSVSSYIDLPANYTNIICAIYPDESFIRFTANGDNVNVAEIGHTVTIPATSRFQGSIAYRRA